MTAIGISLMHAGPNRAALHTGIDHCYWGSGSWSYEKVAGRTSGWLLPADRSIAWSEFTFFNYSISMHA